MKGHYFSFSHISASAVTFNMQLSQEFQQNICVYNSALAFTYIGAKIDDHITGTRSPYTFHIHGEMYHRIGSSIVKPPSFAQIYIFDTDNETQK